MRTTLKLLLVVSATVFGTVAYADSLKLSTSSYSNGSNGGAYTATILSGPATNSSYSSLATLSSTSFETFCLEPTEYFSPGSTYTYTIDSFADGGANEAAGRNLTPGDQLSLGTTWLYSQFATGSLSAATYASSTRKASYLALQRAFWYLEDDYTAYGSALNALNNNVYLSLVALQYGGGVAGLAAAQADAANGANGVWALNITTVSGTSVVKNQSQLYYHLVPSVPEQSATIALLGLATLGLIALRRKAGSSR